MRYGRHRSLCTLTLTNQLETNGSCSGHIGAAAVGRRSSRVDVQSRVERPPVKLQNSASRPAAARRPLHEVGFCELLGLGAHQRSHTSHPKAQNTCGSKLPVMGHDLRTREQSRGCAWWLTVHRVRKPRQRHVMALPATAIHVWDLTWVAAGSRCTCSWSRR